MSNILSYFPGQQATIFLETFDGYGARADGYALPVVSRVILPSFALAAGYPLPMTRLSTGLYYATYTIPTGAVGMGSYLMDVAFINPQNSLVNNTAYQLIVKAPFGNFGTTTG